jgi:hypothetical protein
MPDLLLVFAKKWKFIAGFTLLAAMVALIAAILSPKEYLSVATALPANSVVADKARLFNSNIQELYSDFGSPDELDRIEGTAMLDTIFIAAANELNLPGHYLIDPAGEGFYKSAMKLKKNTRINRSSYGELKVHVWDRDRDMASELANFLLQKLQQLHQHLQNESNAMVLVKLQEDHEKKQKQYKQLSDSLSALTGAEAEMAQSQKAALLDQLQLDQKLMDQYRLAISTNPQVLLTVENARPSLWPDRPRIVPTVLFSFFGALVFAFLISLFVESRKYRS